MNNQVKVFCKWERWEVVIFYCEQSRGVGCFRKLGLPEVGTYNENDFRDLNWGV